MALALALFCLGLTGCGAPRIPGVYEPSKPPATSKPSKKGGTYKPYTVLGQTYYPLGSADGYSETGVASWYGPNFHGKKTANGERYARCSSRTVWPNCSWPAMSPGQLFC